MKDHFHMEGEPLENDVGKHNLNNLSKKSELTSSSNANNERLEKLFHDIEVGITDLKRLITEYGSTGKVPIDGFAFETLYAENLCKALQRILEGGENPRKVSRFINLQLIAASKFWRQMCTTLDHVVL